MSNVDWCPYSQLLEGDTYDSSETYYINNGHYGFEEYTYTTEEAFNIAILNIIQNLLYLCLIVFRL